MDLRPETLLKACKGDVSKLPSFMVHDNQYWGSKGVQLDTQNRIHMSRATFLRSVRTAELPIREGLWVGPSVQQFYIDLKPHHLQGSADAHQEGGHKQSRLITQVDSQGRAPGDRHYGADDNPTEHQGDANDIADDLKSAREAGSRGVKGRWLH